MSSFIKDKIKWGTSGFIGGRSGDGGKRPQGHEIASQSTTRYSPAQIQAPRSPSGAPQIPENYVRDMRAPNRRSSSRFEELNSSLTGSHSHSTHRTQQISDQREQTHDPERPYIVNHSPRSKPQKVSKAQPHVYGDHSIPSGRDPRKPGETVAYGQMIRAERQEPRRGSESSPVRGSRPPHKFPRESLGPRALNSDGATALALGSQNESEFDGRTLRGLFDGLKQTEEFQLRYPYYPYVVLHVDALDRGCERALESEAYLRREIGSMQRNMIALIERNHPHENIDEPDALKFILEQYQTRLDYCLKLEREGKEQFEAYAESIRRRDEIISDRDQEITKLRNQLSQEKLKCDLDLNSCESYYKQKIKHQETAHQQKLKDQKTAHQQQLEDQEYAYQHRLEGLKYAYQQQLEEQKTAHQQQLEDQKAAHQQQLEDQKAAHQQQLEGQKTVHQQQFKDQKAAHEKEISTKEKNMEDQRVEAHMKIQELNRLLITDADNFQPEPDDRFRATFDKLQKNVYLLAKKAKCELHVDREKLGADFDQISFARAVKERHLKLILETSFWRILREKIFLNPFHVFGELGESLFITWCKFFSNSQTRLTSALAWPPPDTRCERWRSSVFEVLRAAVTAQERCSSVNDRIISSYMATRKDVSEAFKVEFSRISPEDMGTTPGDIAEIACSLALDCGRERCRVQLFAPRKGELVQRTQRKSIQDRNEGFNAETEEGMVELIISPGLMKLGDGHGRSFDANIVHLGPSDVYCSVGGEMR